MATTPGGLPYPLGTDFVVDGDNAIRALAEAIDANLFAAWIALTPSTGWNNVSGRGMKYRRESRRVFFDGLISAQSGFTSTLMNFPAGYRPISAQTAGLGFSNNGKTRVTEVTASGNLAFIDGWGPNVAVGDWFAIHGDFAIDL